MSLSSAAVPAVGLLSSAVVLNEQPSGSDIFGFCLVGLGILVVGLADRRQAQRARNIAYQNGIN
jgi:drug/metabolite transporter (DMT)-like permease